MLIILAAGAVIYCCLMLTRRRPPLRSWIPRVSRERVREAGLLVAPYNIDELASALSRLVEDAKLRRQLGDAGRRRVEGELNTAEFARNFASIVAFPR